MSSEALQVVKEVSRTLVNLDSDTVDKVISGVADRIIDKADFILEANKNDLNRMSPDDPKYDRLLLNRERLEAIATDMRSVVAMESPLGRALEDRVLPNGLRLKRVSVPLGVIGIIYEARPNVTFDVFSLCFKSGNAVVLKGGADAEESNRAGVAVIHEVLKEKGISPDVVYLLPATRDAVQELLNADDVVDVIIPRGSQALIEMVRKNARVPVIETGAGIVHTYLDESVDLEMAKRVIANAKTRRVSVCNALDTLVVHEGQLQNLAAVAAPLGEAKVEIFADKEAFAALQGKYPAELLKPADENSYGVEFLSLKMAIKTVKNLDEAIAHINRYTSRHSEAILSDDEDKVARFSREVDAAVVYANTSTAFTDGAQFGLGAEIGISTQKLHARGPMGLRELTSYKWVIEGEGQTRPT